MSYYPPQPAAPPSYPVKPSAHVEATQDQSVSLNPGRAIDIWSPYSKHGHVTGGIEFVNGTLKVPYSGMYFIYCQLFFNPSPQIGRYYIKKNGHDIILVAQSIKGTDTEGPVNINGVFPLNQGDIIHVELANPHRVWNGPSHCFFGMYMI